MMMTGVVAGHCKWIQPKTRSINSDQPPGKVIVTQWIPAAPTVIAINKYLKQEIHILFTVSLIHLCLCFGRGDFGTTLYAFNRKGVVRVVPQLEGQESPLTLDLATEVAIEVGAEDVQETANEDDEALFMVRVLS